MTENNGEERILNPYNVSAGLIVRDIKIIPALYLIIILPHLFAFFYDEIPSVILLILERACQIIFLSIITIRWLNVFRLTPAKPRFKSLFLYFGVGFIVWMIVTIPFLIQALGDLPPNLNGIGMLLVVPALYLLYKYFFYFFPILNGISSPTKIMESSITINRGEPNLPIKTLLPALGFFSLITASFMALSPDGRSLSVNLVISLFAGIFWFLHCYVSLGASLLYWNQKDWHECKLDPYRNARLASISIAAPKILSHFLQPKQGLIALCVSLLVWFANMMSLEITPPAAAITGVQASIKDKNTVSLSLDVEDKEYKLRGFQPMHFSLAGEKRAPVCEEVTKAVIKGESEDRSYILPETPDKLALEIEFKCERDEEALKKLEDLYLWYRGVKLDKIKL
jgi:hypothetical protein